jgi:hypothetical protein
MPRKPEKNKTRKPRPVPRDLAEIQDPEYAPADFEHALEKATERLADGPSRRDRGSSRR